MKLAPFYPGADDFNGGRYQEALEEIEKASKLLHDQPDVRFLLEAIHAKLGHAGLAREQLLSVVNEKSPGVSEKRDSASHCF